MGVYAVGEFLERAEKLMDAGDQVSLRYACLELRLSLEKIVYQKLAQLKDKIPPAVYRTWQPQKALKLLLSFEPRADQDNTIDIRQNNADGTPAGDWIHLGEYRMFSAKRLNTLYNKVGKYLHTPSLKEHDTLQPLTHAMISDVLEEIKRVAEATIVVSVNSINNVECKFCRHPVYVSKSQIDSGSIVECYNQKCEAKYAVKRVDNEQFEIRSHTLCTFVCKACGNESSLDLPEHGAIKQCVSCEQPHVFLMRCYEWKGEAGNEDQTA
ncbi:hypothetical protein FBY03_111125 [Pseudomonas sp. SJZ079]|uniref:hypothetical protein n=1 Tax=Pseudomonas sp. SJZ079 TaxID=2572887 RepID=UPI00119AC8E1|nr:hypothetical protein [Pseudomonas sp. SJZ079]TWC35077.1 hypothetical protein FBY03_111125 [Pseudomonas sp. SJZ079]